MLLLGAGESGKSTILKQMKLIHQVRSLCCRALYMLTIVSRGQGSYSEDERESYKEIIYSNTVQSMHVILDAMDMMGISLANAGQNQSRADIVMGLPHQIEGDSLEPNVTDAIQGLWRDEGVRKCFERSREFQLNDSAQ